MAKKPRYLQRRGSVGKSDASELIMPLLLLGGGYLLFTKILGAGGTGSNNSTVDANTAATSAAGVQQAAAAGSKQTITDSTLSTLANTLYYQFTASTPDQSGMLNNLIQVNTWADWQRLVQLFGTRRGDVNPSWYDACQLTGFNCDAVDLGTFINQTLDSTRKQELNSYFSAANIPVSF
jgi:hypothetical protein